MLTSPQFLTFWQVASKWAEETNLPVMDIVMAMKSAATYPMPSTRPAEPPPPLKIWPSAFFHPRSGINEYSVFVATEMVDTHRTTKISKQDHALALR